MNALIIPEDFRKDQYILGPVIQKMFAEIGKPHVKVRMCLDPLLGGISQATRWERIGEIIGMYPMVQVFLLLVDRDGVEGRRQVLDNLETKAAAVLGNARILLGENAWQEIEVWALAGLELPKQWNWQAIRTEEHPKEKYFLPLAEKRGLLEEPGEGRTTLGREAAANYKRILSRCKEDVEALQKRLSDWMGK